MPANSANTTAPGGGESQISACRESVKSLRRILDQLFPDAQNPDILTVEDVIRRYPLTQLGGPATAAMEQSRRIARARRDFTQMGLAEFHAGLIYLHWGDSRAAAQQFAAARTQWSLAGEIPHGCLAHFAQGVALQHSYHYEAAMSQFGWTERCLSRNQAGAQARKLGELGAVLWPLLEAAQQAIRPNLWPQEEGSSADALPNRPVAAPITPDQAARMPEAGDEPAVEVEPESHQTTPKIVAPPISNMPLTRSGHWKGPIPGHNQEDTRLRWFVVHVRDDELLPGITEGTLVLVDTQPAPLADGVDEEMVVIGGPRKDIGSVIIRPRTDTPEKPYYFLGYRTAPPDGLNDPASESALRMDISGHALPIPDAVFIGIVLGFWHSVIS